MSALVLPTVRIDLESRWLEPADGPPERLTTLEARVLQHLAANTHRVVGRDELLAEVWGYAPSSVSRTCDTTIRRLRVKIEVDPANPEFLLTVHGAGYRLVLARETEAVPVVPVSGVRRCIALADRTVDLDRARVDGPSGTVALSANEVAVLGLLASRGGRSVDRNEILRKVWGSSAGRPLQHAINRLRRKIEADPARPVFVLTTADGYRLEVDAGLPLPERSTAGNLPTEIDRWVGRDRELAEVVARIERGDRLVVLVGPGGIGKSRLAAAAARQLGTSRAAWWFDLTDVSRAAGAYAAIARQLGVPLVGGDPAAQVGRALAALGRAVVVLDNLEELAGPEAAVIHRLVEAAPGCAFLGTSRVLLRVQGERRIEVGPLAPIDGERLFLERAIRPPAPAERLEVAALIAALDGVPLAIELAAAATRVLSVADLCRRSRVRLLGSGDHDRPERHRSLTASLDGSWELLSPWARAALAQLSVFRDGFVVDAAEQVLDLRDWPEVDWTIDVIEELCDASLLRLAPDGSRFGFLGMIAHYAADRLDGPARSAAEIRHGAWCASLGDVRALAAVNGPAEVELRRALGAELGNLIVATERALARGDAAVASATVCAAWTVLELTGPVDTAADLLERAASLPGAEPRVATAAGRALVRIGALDRAETRFRQASPADPWATLGLAGALALHRDDTAESTAAAALAEAVATRDVALECACRIELGVRRRSRSDNEAAYDLVQEAVRLAAGLGARRLRAQAERRLGRLHLALGRLDEARAAWTSASAIAADVGDRVLQGWILGDLGTLATRAGGESDGRKWLLAAIELQRDLGDRLGQVHTLTQLGRSYVLEGRAEEAEQAFADALHLAREIGAPEHEVTIIGNRANHALRRGHHAEAERTFVEMRERSRAHGLVRSEAHATANLANLYAELDRKDEARVLFAAALELSRAVGDASAVGAILGNMGVDAEESGDLAAARALTLEALEIHGQTGEARFVAGWNETLARVSMREGDVAAARGYAAEAERGFRQVGDLHHLGRTLLIRADLELAAGDPDRAAATRVEAEGLLAGRR